MLARAIQSAMGGDIYPPDLAQYGRAIVFDPQDLKTLFQDASGTIPVTGVEQPVGLMLDKGGGNFHATQPTAGSRPTLSARYNILTYTENFAVSEWTKQGITVSSSVNLTEAAQSSIHGVRTPSVVSVLPGSSYVFRAKVKASGRNCVLLFCNNSTSGRYFDITPGSSGAVLGNYSGTVVPATIESVGNDEFICSMTIVATSFGALFEFYLSDTGSRISYAGDTSKGVILKWLSVTQANQSSLPYQSVTSSTAYDSDPSKFPWYLRFTDHWMVTPSIDATAYDKVMVACGLRKMSDVARGTVIESSATIASNNGAFALTAPQAAAASIGMESKGTALTDAIATALSAPITRSVVALASISADSNVIRVNGAAADTDSGDQGTGNFGNYPIYIGERAGTSLPFNGHFYGATILFPTALPNDNIIASLERHYAAKAGIKL